MKKIGIIAPSGCVENFCEYEVKNFFARYKTDAAVFPSCMAKFRYMAGQDYLRADDINSAFSDKTIDAIICARGGYGAIRLLDKIDYKIIKENKKPFVGFSDVTALLIAFYKKAGLCGFHGKMVANGVLNMTDEEFLNYKKSIETPSFSSKLTGGVLWGGNLATIVSLFGGEDFIPNDDIILFVEDINEPDYKLDRMFAQILRNKSLCPKIKGVIFGDFIGAGKYLNEIQKEFAEKLNVPYEFNLNIGHGKINITVPFGLHI